MTTVFVHQLSCAATLPRGQFRKFRLRLALESKCLVSRFYDGQALILLWAIVGMPCQVRVDPGLYPGGPMHLCEGPPKSEVSAVVQMSLWGDPSPEVLCQEYDDGIDLSSTFH